MVGFFRNMFQQTGFIPTEDFKLQLLQNGGFDFGGSTRNVGDDAFPRLVQNLQDSFALTAWQLVKEGRPFTETLTTTRFRMTTALKSLYVQIEMPADTNQRSTSTTVLNWTIDFSGTSIPIEQALTNMVFSDEAPGLTSATNTGMCRGTGTVASGAYKGTSVLFQRLLGFTPQLRDSTNTTICNDHASKPYFTADDVNDWTWVTITPKASAGRPHAGDPALRPARAARGDHADAVAAALRLLHDAGVPGAVEHQRQQPAPRHRQPDAAGRARARRSPPRTRSRRSRPRASTRNHAVAGTECVGCHATLDPMRQFWANQLDFNDRNDFQAASRNNPGNPRPTGTLVDEFAFGDMKRDRIQHGDLGGYLAQVTDGAGLPRFGISVVQQLCFYANSSPCNESDAEFRRIVGVFKDSTFNYAVLAKEFFSSPIVTGAAATGSHRRRRGPRQHRAPRPPVRGAVEPPGQARPVRAGGRAAAARRRPRPPASRPASPPTRSAAAPQSPVTPTEPTMFYRAATEMLCENIATQVVDATSGAVYTSADIPGAINGDGRDGDGLPAQPPAARAGGADSDGPPGRRRRRARADRPPAKATVGLRSAFALACESPRALGIGL